MRYWRQVRAVSMEAAVATYSARYRRHWGAELALQEARLRFSRAYVTFQAPSCQADMTFGTSSIGFDPADYAQYAAEAAPILGGPPSGQDRYYLFAPPPPDHDKPLALHLHAALMFSRFTPVHTVL